MLIRTIQVGYAAHLLCEMQKIVRLCYIGSQRNIYFPMLKCTIQAESQWLDPVPYRYT